MLSMFKENRGIRSLYPTDADWTPAALSERNAEDGLYQSGGAAVDTTSAAVQLIIARAQRRRGIPSAAGQQRCQRCWKVFHVGPLTDRSSFVCWRCEYSICPNCREPDPRGSGWKCCSCVKPMSLMRLFETTKSGRELVIRVMAFCDPRAERILKSFFRFASLYAISSTSAAGRGAGARNQLSQGVASRIKAHLDLMQRESPPPSSYAYSVSPGQQGTMETPSRCGDEEEEEGSRIKGKLASGNRSIRTLLGALSPNVVSGAGAVPGKVPYSHCDPAAVGGKENSLDRLCVSESTHRCSTVLADNVEKRLSGGGRLSGTSLGPRGAPSDGDRSYAERLAIRTGRDNSEKALFVDDDDDETASPLLREPLRHGAALARSTLERAPQEGRPRSESPAPRFPDFSTFLEDHALAVKQHPELEHQPLVRHHHHQQQQQQQQQQAPFNLDAVSISSESDTSVLELGVQRGSTSASVPTPAQRRPGKSPQTAVKAGSSALRQPSGSLTNNSAEPRPPTPFNSPPTKTTSSAHRSLPTADSSAPSSLHTTHRSARDSKLATPFPEGAASPHTTATTTTKSTPLTAPKLSASEKKSNGTPLPATAAPSPAAPPRSAALLVRTDSVLQAFERLASDLAERQRQQDGETKSHPVLLTGTAAPAKQRTASASVSTRYPYSQRAAPTDTALHSKSNAAGANAFQRTGSRFGRTASNTNPHLRPHKSTTVGPRARTTVPTPTPSSASNSSAAGSGRIHGIRVVHQVAGSSSASGSVYSRLYGNGTRAPRRGYGQPDGAAAPRPISPSSTCRTPRTATPTTVHQPVPSHTSQAGAAGAAAAPDLLTRQPSSYVRVASSTNAPPLTRTETAIPSRLQRSHSNPQGGASQSPQPPFSRTASRIAVGAVHVDPVFTRSLSARGRRAESPPLDGHTGEREGAGRRHTPTPMRTATPLARQDTAAARLVREPSNTDTFARIPTTKNFERLCSLHRHHGLGDGAVAQRSPPPATSGQSAIAAFATKGLQSLDEEALRVHLRHTSPASQRALDPLSRTTPTPQRTPRTMLLATPRLSPRAAVSPTGGHAKSPRPQINSNASRQHTPSAPSVSRSPAGRSPGYAGTPSPLPKRPPLTPTASVSPAKSTGLASPSPSPSLPPRPDKTPQCTPGKAPTTPTTSPSVKGRAKVSIHVTTIPSPRAKLLPTKVATATPRAVNRTAVSSSTVSRSPAASHIAKKHVGSTVRLKEREHVHKGGAALHTHTHKKKNNNWSDSPDSTLRTALHRGGESMITCCVHSLHRQLETLYNTISKTKQKN
eukprot:gene11400-7905_t